ncbi:MAG: amidohydrolase family protein [Sedimentisphaerales bacterium]|nr:amidohydrolase family protein [Sedimentisphaerales bacterium]
MPDLLIKNANVISLEEVLADYSVLCENGKISRIAPSRAFQNASADKVVDASGLYLAPGFIDLHTHAIEHYLVDNGPEDLAEICKLLPKYGVTGLLVGVCPRPKGEGAQFLKSLAKVRSQGSQILGFHLEGPFLKMKFWHHEAVSSSPSDQVKALIEAAKPYKAVFSISPDFEGILDLIPLMKENNTTIFMTHTAANVKQTKDAIEAGAHHATHFYDAFWSPPETDPGVRPCGAVEAILADERVSVDFILDGEHVDPVAVKMALACKGPDRVCLVTDANIGAGLPPDKYIMYDGEEIEFTYPGGPARRTEKSYEPGSLAGSGLTFDLAVSNAIKMLGVSLPQAVRMASANPAKVLSLDKVKGQIKEGFDADMILLDESLKVLQTWVRGKCCFPILKQ